jgi:hypothetical protein
MDWIKFWSDYWPAVASTLSASAITGAATFLLPRRFPYLLNQVTGNNIQITSPSPMQGLIEKRSADGGNTYAVSGTLRHLPKGHVIWLLVQEEKSEHVWPQCAETVDYNRIERRWTGRVHVGHGKSKATIVAVVAPTTSDDYFCYFCANGTRTRWAVLKRLPQECKNFDKVTAMVT